MLLLFCEEKNHPYYYNFELWVVIVLLVGSNFIGCVLMFDFENIFFMSKSMIVRNLMFANIIFVIIISFFKNHFLPI
jgi:hypothetical protein